MRVTSEICALLEMNEEALKELDLEIRGTRSDPCILYFELLRTPSYDCLRSAPRFQAFLQRERALYEGNMARLVDHSAAPPET